MKNSEALLPRTDADIAIAVDGAVLIATEDLTLKQGDRVHARLTDYGIQLFSREKLLLDLHTPVEGVKQALRIAAASKKPRLSLMQVIDASSIQVFDNILFK